MNEPTAKQVAAAQTAALAWFAEPTEAIGCVGWLDEGGVWWAVRAARAWGCAFTVGDAWACVDRYKGGA